METHPTRVLLIEDDEDDYILLQKMLVKIPHEHYELQWEPEYVSGLARMLETEPDICMIDYRLGAENGIELVKEARGRGYRGPIILLTGAEGDTIDIQALQAGADDYVAKGQLQSELLYRIMRYAIERKKTEHEREKLLSEQLAARELELRRTEFIAMVVHELKTPLTSLKGYTQLLRLKYGRNAGDEQAAHFTARIDAQVKKLTDLIDDFMDVTRIASGKLQFHEEYFSFDELVEEIAQEMHMLDEQQVIRREGETQKDIWGDRLRIGQVITNLVSNAMKYAPSAEGIVLKSSVEGEYVRFCVQDFGPGIPAEVREKIFDPFFRVEHQSDKKVSGLGLGLHIAAEIIQRQRGRIWVESEEGRGAVFCFELPVEQQRGVEEKEGAHASPKDGGKRP